MRTHCIGRLLIDLPEDFEMAPLSEVELIYGLDENWRKVTVTVPGTEDSQPTLQALSSKLMAELTARFSPETPSKNFLDSVHNINADTVLIREHEEPEMKGYFKSTVFAKRDNVIGEFQADIYKKDKPEDIEAKLLSIAQRTSHISDPDKVGKGTCLGPLLIDAGQDGEWFMLSFYSPKDPVLHIGVNMNSLRAEAEDGGLIARTDRRTAEFLRPMGIKLDFIRRGKVLLADGPGEEQVFRYEENGVKYLSFASEALQTPAATQSAPLVATQTAPPWPR